MSITEDIYVALTLEAIRTRAGALTELIEMAGKLENETDLGVRSRIGTMLDNTLEPMGTTREELLRDSPTALIKAVEPDMVRAARLSVVADIVYKMELRAINNELNAPT